MIENEGTIMIQDEVRSLSLLSGGEESICSRVGMSESGLDFSVQYLRNTVCAHRPPPAATRFVYRLVRACIQAAFSSAENLLPLVNTVHCVDISFHGVYDVRGVFRGT